MPNYRRSITPGGTFFFTLITFNRRQIFNIPVARQYLRESWSDTVKTFPFTRDAICLLPDHIHCIWTLPENDYDFSKR